MNSYQLKIVGTAEIPEALDASKSLAIHTELDIYSVEKLDDQNGNFTIRYKAKICSAIDTIQGEKHLISKDPRKMSVRVRRFLENEADVLGIDREKYYHDELEKFMSNRKI